MAEWSYDIGVKISGSGIEADTKEEAIQKIKDQFKEENNMDLTDDEISNVEEFE